MGARNYKKIPVIKGRKKGCDLMSANGLKNMILKFEEAGSFEGKTGKGRK